MRRAVPMVLAAAIFAAFALPARAATTTIQMTDGFTFDPTPVSVTVGDTVQWHNGSFTTHTATSNTGLFDMTVDQSQTKSKAFKFAGSFPYYCRFHGSPGAGMHGTVNVPDRWLNTGTQHVGDVQRIRIASVNAPNGISFNIQFKGPGDDAFHVFHRHLINAVISYTPTKAGEYLFRSRELRESDGALSGWSPPAFVEISS